MAKELIFLPLMDELQQGKDRATRQSACYVIRKLNERYMEPKNDKGAQNPFYDPNVVDNVHALNLSEICVKSKICDADFLGCLSDMIYKFGPTFVLGKHISKAIPHFIWSIKYNMGGTNAVGKVHRDKNIEESLKLLTLIPQQIDKLKLDYSKDVSDSYTDDVMRHLDMLKGENNKTLKLK